MAIILYRQFIFGGVSYFYTNSDGYAQFMSQLVNLINHSGEYPMWSFSVGLGAQISNSWLNPFYLIPLLLGAENIEYSRLWVQISAIVISCLFFYLFLKKLNFHPVVCSVISIMYSFNGIIILRGNWASYAIECAVIAFLLYAVEIYFNNYKKWFLVTLAITLITFSLSFYHVFLYSLLLFIYVTIRFINIYKFTFKKYLFFMGRNTFILLLGLFISAIIFLPNIVLITSTSRFESTIGSLSSVFLFLPVSGQEFFSIFYSFFSSDIFGVFDMYSGWGNYLEGPLFYCGLIVLFLVPQTFIFTNKKSRILLLISFFFVFIYLIFPGVRNMVNLYIHNSYKTTSLWILIFMLVIAGYTLNNIINNKKINQNILIITFLLLIIPFILFIPMLEKYNIGFQNNIALQVVIFLVINFILLFIFSTKKNKFILIPLITIVIIELFIFSGITVNRSGFYSMVKKYHFDHSGISGHSNFVNTIRAAVDHIKTYDNSQFYRISNGLIYMNFTIPLLLDFYSDSYYTSFLPPNYSRFAGLQMSDSIIQGIHNYGGYFNPYLQTVLGFKYRISHSDSPPPYGYELIGYDFNNNIAIYENMLSLPIGFAVNNYIQESDYLKMNKTQQVITLLNAVVLSGHDKALIPYSLPSNEDIYEVYGDLYGLYEQSVIMRQAEPFTIKSFKQNNIIGNVKSSKDGYLFFSIPYAKGWKAYLNNKPVNIELVNIGFIGIKIPEGSHTVELKYVTPGLIPGAIISGIGIVIFIAIILIQVKREKRIK